MKVDFKNRSEVEKCGGISRSLEIQNYTFPPAHKDHSLPFLILSRPRVRTSKNYEIK